MGNRCDIKKIFGKTLHKNMSASDLQSIWYSIPEDVRKKHKDVEKMVTVAAMSEKILLEAIPKYEAAKKAIELQKNIVLSSAATAAGNLTFGIQKLAEETAKKVIDDLNDKVTNTVEETKKTLMNKFKEISGCFENNEKQEI